MFCLSQLAPEGPPTNISILAVNTTAIAINMSLPVEDVVNGIILGYQVTIWSKEDSEVHMNFTRENNGEEQTEVVIGGLRKFFVHNITIKAYTKIGLGVNSTEMTVRTLEDGKKTRNSKLTH